MVLWVKGKAFFIECTEWYKYSHHGKFQATNMASLRGEEIHNWPCILVLAISSLLWDSQISTEEDLCRGGMKQIRGKITSDLRLKSRHFSKAKKKKEYKEQ
jgi:hypothetical protein